MGSIGPTSLGKADPEQLKHALNQAVKSYNASHPLSKKSYDEACLYMPGGNTRTVLYTSPFPFTIDRASGSTIHTLDGKEYVDFLGEYTAGIYGHNNQIIRAAVEKALENGWNYGGHSKVEQDFARTICTRFPSMEKVRFVNSGTEANMMALATSLAYANLNHSQDKSKVLIFEKGYHGSTISGRAPSGKPTINLPHDFVLGSYNDVEATAQLVSSLPKGSLAAILVEPMLGSGGCYTATPAFLQMLRQLADEHQSLLIFDEVMTSRLSYHGYHSEYGIKPDLMTVGKYLGGGMTFGAFGGRNDLMALYDPRKGQLEHPGTFNNNVFTMHAGVAGCNLLTPERLQELNDRGVKMRNTIADILERYNILIGGTLPNAPLLGDAIHKAENTSRPPKMFVKGQGSLLCIHFAGPDRDLLQGLFYHHMLQHGIYMAQRGFIALSLEITDNHIEKFTAAADSFCQQWQSSLCW